MVKMNYFRIIVLAFGMALPGFTTAQDKSIARHWMDTYLEVIPHDASRPTIHARNLYHLSLAMYEAWAAFEPDQPTFMLGKTYKDFSCPCEIPDFNQLTKDSLESARKRAISYAAYRVIFFRLNEYSTKNSYLEHVMDTFALSLGYDRGIQSQNYQEGDPAALGNYIADCVTNFGVEDGAAELDNHETRFYNPRNPMLDVSKPANPDLLYPNHWQPLDLRAYNRLNGIDPTFDFDIISTNGLNPTDDFLTPEWGWVKPFALTDDDLQVYVEKKIRYPVYLDPGAPPYFKLDPADSILTQNYLWNFLTVLYWSRHLDPADSVKIDISPGAIGNTQDLPREFEAYKAFFDLQKGGTRSLGHQKNPSTRKPYAPNWVYRGDYARVIAEYWVDGVGTVSPPGHWMSTLNYVTDHQKFKRKWGGKGKKLDALEWDVKSYLLMAGAMHDAAIAAWSVKGYYDYIRPISVIRWRAGVGQNSDSTLPAYYPYGLPLIPGLVELVEEGDPLAGANNEHLHKIKLYAWRGHEAFSDPRKERAGVGWMLGESWWPYQRYGASTPPFAGYVSGHSTFSAAGAEVMTRLTGDPFFPGGLAEFTATKNTFLQFEKGPSQDVTLQWATYEDAAGECALSRIWGGIHPPSDDIPGRWMGQEVGKKAFEWMNEKLGEKPK
jgi:membrane-associated phospholipid phosphatase